MWLRQKLLCPSFCGADGGADSLQSRVILRNYGDVLGSEPLTSTTDQEPPLELEILSDIEVAEQRQVLT